MKEVKYMSYLSEYNKQIINDYYTPVPLITVCEKSLFKLTNLVFVVMTCPITTRCSYYQFFKKYT